MSRADELLARRAQETAAEQPITRADRLASKSRPMQEASVPTMSRADQLLAGYDSSTSPYTTHRKRQSIFSAGIDAGQGNFQLGLSELVGAAGQEDAQEWLKKMSDKNLADATVDRDGFWDDVQFAAGQVVPSIGAAMTGAALAPFAGLTATVGAGIAGFAASWGMNAGDFFQKQKAEDPNYEIKSSDLLWPTLLAAPDIAPGVGAVARGAKLFKPLGDAVADTVVNQATKLGVGATLGRFGTEVAKTAVTQGAIEGAQDFTGSVGAVLSTGGELTPEKIDSFARASAYEAAIGSVIGGAFGGAISTSEEIALREAAYNETRPKLVSTPLQDAEGNLSSEFRDLVLVPGAVKQPGFISKGADVLFGASVDPLRRRFKNSKKLNALLDTIHVNRINRAPGHLTNNERARGFEGQMLQAAKVFNNATRQEREAAYKKKSEGIAPSNEVEAALWFAFNEQIPKLYDNVTRGKAKDISKGLFGDPTYLPTGDALDWSAMSKKSDLLESAKADMTARGIEPERIASTLATLKQQLKDFEDTGDHLFTAKTANTNKIQKSIVKALEEQQESGKPLTAKRKAAWKAMLSKEYKQTTKQGVLTLDRSLSALSNEWMYKNFRKVDPKDSFNAHIRQVAEQAAMIESYGIDNRLFDEAVLEIVAEQYNTENPFTASDIEELYDVLRTQQRIHLKPLPSSTVRKAQNGVRAALNVKLLGLSALVSIPEAMTIFMNAGGKATLQGLMQTMLKTVSPNGMGLAAEQVGYTLNNAVRGTINRTGEESFEVKGWEQLFFRFTGLPYLQHFLTVWSARSFDVHIKEMLTELQDGVVSSGRLNYLNRKIEEAGLDVEQAKLWASSGFSEDSTYFKEAYIPALIGLTQDTIVDPHPVDKPLWMNDERFLLVSQLKGFMTVFTNRIMRGWVQNARAGRIEGKVALATKVAPYVAMYIAAQIGMQAAREVAKNGDLDDWDEKEIEERARTAFGYLGAFGYFIDTIHASEWNKGPISANLGPAFATGERLVGGTIRALESSDPEKVLDNFLKSTMPNSPFSGLALEAMGVE
jgi:hypothetical protein